MKTLLEALCEAARRHPRHLRDSNPNSLIWFPGAEKPVCLPDLSFLSLGFFFSQKGY